MLSITLLDTDNSDGSVATGIEQGEKLSDYIDQLVLPSSSDPEVSDEVKEHLKVKPIFLTRSAKLRL